MRFEAPPNNKEVLVPILEVADKCITLSMKDSEGNVNTLLAIDADTGRLTLYAGVGLEGICVDEQGYIQIERE